ncbi:MAG: hydroxymyristoyl-ACP dehydratase [Betaproteobacteria bacterium]
MPLDHDWIAQRIPHHGAMCLLDRVLRWDESAIVCAANNHRQADHPLRAHGRLSATCGIEYAAQAMAVHGALLAGVGADPAAPRIGMLTSVRGIALHVGRLDDVDGELSIEARRVAGDRTAIAYEFSLHAGERALLSGRATVILDAGASGEDR